MINRFCGYNKLIFTRLVHPLTVLQMLLYIHPDIYPDIYPAIAILLSA